MRSPDGGDGGSGGGRGGGGARGGGPHGSYGGGRSSAVECEGGQVTCDPKKDNCRDECGRGWFCQLEDDDDDEGVCTSASHSGAGRGPRPFGIFDKREDLIAE